ncbi:MAG: hypothetical protein HYT28_03845 [Parcubacteria group bacterium]|nr:hypothetical protein [Parcubacteria group bacterium]
MKKETKREMLERLRKQKKEMEQKKKKNFWLVISMAAILVWLVTIAVTSWQDRSQRSQKEFKMIDSLMK